MTIMVISISSYAARGVYGQKIFNTCVRAKTYQQRIGNEKVGPITTVQFDCKDGETVPDRFSISIDKPGYQTQGRYTCSNKPIGYAGIFFDHYKDREAFVYNCVGDVSVDSSGQLRFWLASIGPEKLERYSDAKDWNNLLKFGEQRIQEEVESVRSLLLGDSPINPKNPGVGKNFLASWNSYPIHETYYAPDCDPGKCGISQNSEKKNTERNYQAEAYFSVRPSLCDLPTPTNLPSVWDLKNWGWSERISNPQYRENDSEKYAAAASNMDYIDQIQYIFGIGPMSSFDARKSAGRRSGGYVNLHDKFLDIVNKNPNMSFSCALSKATYIFADQFRNISPTLKRFMKNDFNASTCMEKSDEAAWKLRYDEPCANHAMSENARDYVVFDK